MLGRGPRLVQVLGPLGHNVAQILHGNIRGVLALDHVKLNEFGQEQIAGFPVAVVLVVVDVEGVGLSGHSLVPPLVQRLGAAVGRLVEPADAHGVLAHVQKRVHGRQLVAQGAVLLAGVVFLLDACTLFANVLGQLAKAFAGRLVCPHQRIKNRNAKLASKP